MFSVTVLLVTLFAIDIRALRIASIVPAIVFYWTERRA